MSEHLTVRIGRGLLVDSAGLGAYACSPTEATGERATLTCPSVDDPRGLTTGGSETYVYVRRSPTLLIAPSWPLRRTVRSPVHAELQVQGSLLFLSPPAAQPRIDSRIEGDATTYYILHDGEDGQRNASFSVGLVLSSGS